jgi:[ribosomal protein S5]-alanine N-acetyltransferase
MRLVKIEQIFTFLNKRCFMITGEILTGTRIRLEPVHLEQADGLFTVFSDSRAMVYWNTPTHANLAETTSMIRGILACGERWWAIIRQDTGQVIGGIWFIDASVPGMGYIIHPDHWRQAYGAEAGNLALDYGFTKMSLNRVELWIESENIASQRLAAKLGFTKHGHFFQRYPNRAKPHDTLTFGLRADEWASQQNRTAPVTQRTLAFLAIHPVVRVRDVAQAVTFYQGQLGFDVEYLDGQRFAIVARGEWSAERVRIHFVYNDEPDKPGAFYITVGMTADLLYAELQAKGVKITRELTTEPYGRREFEIEDLNGWRLIFASAV